LRTRGRIPDGLLCRILERGPGETVRGKKGKGWNKRKRWCPKKKQEKD